MTLLIICVVGAILISFSCSITESVLYSVPESHVEYLATHGTKSGKLLKRLRDKIEEPITVILALNTSANTVGATLTGAMMIEIYGEEILAYYSALFTLAILILGEIVPKTIGVRYARPLSRFIALPLYIMVVLLKPIVVLSGLISSVINSGKTQSGPSSEEIRIMTYLGIRAGTIQELEGGVIQNILALKSKTAEELMTHQGEVFSLSSHLSVAEARLLISEYQYSRIPVYDRDKEDIVGVILQQDLWKIVLDEKEDEHKVMTLMKPVNFVSKKTNGKKLLEDFIKRQQHLFVVVDEQGNLVGIITLEDVLESIVGKEINDEFDSIEQMQDEVRKRRENLLQTLGNQENSSHSSKLSSPKK